MAIVFDIGPLLRQKLKLASAKACVANMGFPEYMLVVIVVQSTSIVHTILCTYI